MLPVFTFVRLGGKMFENNKFACSSNIDLRSEVLKSIKLHLFPTLHTFWFLEKTTLHKEILPTNTYKSPIPRKWKPH